MSTHALAAASEAYDRIADHAWSLAMAVLDDADAAARVIVEAFRRQGFHSGRPSDLAILTDVVRLARGGTSGAAG